MIRSLIGKTKCNIDELTELNTDKNYFGGNFFTETINTPPQPYPSQGREPTEFLLQPQQQRRKPLGLLTPPPAKGEDGRGYYK